MNIACWIALSVGTLAFVHGVMVTIHALRSMFPDNGIAGLGGIIGTIAALLVCGCCLLVVLASSKTEVSSKLIAHAKIFLASCTVMLLLQVVSIFVAGVIQLRM